MNDEKKIKQAFKELFSHELSNPEVKRAKKNLIAEFSGRPVFNWKPVTLIPVFSLILAVILIYQLPKQPTVQPPILIEVKPAVLPAADLKPINVKKVSKEIKKIINTQAPLDVKVTRVSSDVGSAMVYQKNYQDNPVTIVWVFTGGGKQ